VHWHSWVWLIGDGTLLAVLLAELWSLNRSNKRAATKSGDDTNAL
jgi:hypothetical protein